MKTLLIILLIAHTTLPMRADEDKKTTVLTSRLGSAFGKIIEIEGKIVDDRDTRLRSHLGKKLLEVYHVGKRKLEKPVVIELGVFSFTDIKIPNRGTQVRFRGYETGYFVGIPRKAFKDIPIVATTNHHFQSRFQITKRLEPTKAEQDGSGKPATAPQSKSQNNKNTKQESKGRSQ